MERDFLTIEPPPVFEYDSFEPDAPLLRLINAECTDGVARLTQAVGDRRGDAWRDEPYDLSRGFSTTFEFQITDCDPELGGGDGFAFNVRSHYYTGIPDAPVGVGGTPDGLCVQFVTQRNEGAGDPSDNFIRVFFYEELWAVYDLSGDNGFNLKDGQPHVITIEIVEGHKLRVWRGTWRRKRSDLLFEQPGTYFDHFQRAYVGLTASTGLAFCRQDIRRWSLTAGPAIKPVRRPSLVAWWPANGSAEDVAGGHYSVSEVIHYGDGQVGQALGLGANSLLRILPSVLLDVGSSPEGFTLEVWVRPSADIGGVPGGGTIFEWEGRAMEFGVTTTRPHALIVEMDGQNTIDHSFVAPDDVIETGVYNHVALTYDRPTGVAKLYCNGAQVATETFRSFCVPTTQALLIGRHREGRQFLGTIDEPKLYSRALSGEEIAASYQLGLAHAAASVTVSGGVWDVNGEPLRGVAVVLRNVDTSSRSRPGRIHYTDKKGAFSFVDVPKGCNYQVFLLEGAEYYRPAVYDLPNLQEPQRLSFSGTGLLGARKSVGDAEPRGDEKK